MVEELKTSKKTKTVCCRFIPQPRNCRKLRHSFSLRRSTPVESRGHGTSLKERERTNRREGGSGGIPLARKACYALGGVPHQMTSVAMGVSLQMFLLDVVQLEASSVSVILFVSRAWDAVSDPLVGYLVGRSRRTPVGKLTPWLLLSAPFGVLSYLLLWSMPPGSASPAVRTLWFLAAACLFETLMSCYNVPYLALGMFLGGDRRDRDSATAYSKSVLRRARRGCRRGGGLQYPITDPHNSMRQRCQNTSKRLFFFFRPQSAFLTSALVVGSLFFLCSLVLFLGVTEQRGESLTAYLTSLKTVLGHVPFRRLVLGFVFCILAFQMSLCNFALFCRHAAGLGAQFQHLLLVLLVAASVAVPLWQNVLLRVGKRRTVLIGLSLFVPAVSIVACVPSNLPVFMIMCVLMGFSVATIFLLPWSMLPDVVDDFAEKHPTCSGLEPLFFSCYTFCSKLAGGVAVGISTMTLQLVGYRAGACSHGEAVGTALTVLFSPLPIALLLAGMVFFRSDAVDERRLRLTPVQVNTGQRQPRDAGVESYSSPGRSRRVKSEAPKIPRRQKSSSKSSPSDGNTLSCPEVPESDAAPFSRRPHVKSKVSWV
uniref:Uncharacterized protein n=1 Tax=Mola mola TaxID=94237 RepID=A0A3Q3XI48_MOLML